MYKPCYWSEIKNEYLKQVKIAIKKRKKTPENKKIIKKKYIHYIKHRIGASLARSVEGRLVGLKPKFERYSPNL